MLSEEHDRSCSPIAMSRIENIKHKGVGLVSRRKICAGGAVLLEEPYETTLNGDEACKRSHLTFKPSSSLQRCSGCKFAWCSSFFAFSHVNMGNLQCVGSAKKTA